MAKKFFFSKKKVQLKSLEKDIILILNKILQRTGKLAIIYFNKIGNL